MQISDKDAADFQKLWKERYGEDISLGQARAELSNLVEFLLLMLDEPEPK